MRIDHYRLWGSVSSSVIFGLGNGQTYWNPIPNDFVRDWVVKAERTNRDDEQVEVADIRK